MAVPGFRAPKNPWKREDSSIVVFLREVLWCFYGGGWCLAGSLHCFTNVHSPKSHAVSVNRFNHFPKSRQDSRQASYFGNTARGLQLFFGSFDPRSLKIRAALAAAAGGILP